MGGLFKLRKFKIGKSKIKAVYFMYSLLKGVNILKNLYLCSFILGIALSGCASHTTPYSVEDPTIFGNYLGPSTAKMMQMNLARYWTSYYKAQEASGYTIIGKDLKIVISTAGSQVVPNKEFDKVLRNIGGQLILVTKYNLETQISSTQAYSQFFKEGTTLSRTLCSDFFRRASRASSYRQGSKSGINITGGLISGIMGLAGTASSVVGGTSLLFSSLESGFDAYDSAFIVTADFGLMERLVKEKQEAYRDKVNLKAFTHVSDVTYALNQYTYYCTFTGMKAILDEAVTESIKSTQANQLSPESRAAVSEFTTQLLASELAKSNVVSAEAQKEKKRSLDSKQVEFILLYETKHDLGNTIKEKEIEIGNLQTKLSGLTREKQAEAAKELETLKTALTEAREVGKSLNAEYDSLAKELKKIDKAITETNNEQ
jgi:hypothetical protein